MTVSAWIDSALAISRDEEVVIIVEESHELNLRWAANALTTNGQMVATQASIVAIDRRSQGAASASLSGPVVSEKDLQELVTQACSQARQAPLSDDAMPLVAGERDANFSLPAQEIEVTEFANLAKQLGAAFQHAAAAGQLLFGFAELHRCTSWLATTTGVRRRQVQPMGRFEFTAKSPDFVNSAWVGQQTYDFADVDVAAHYQELQRRLAWGERRVELPAGHYDTILSPGAFVDLIVPVTWELSARDAEEGRTCFAGDTVGSSRIGNRYGKLPFTIATDPQLAGLEVADFVMAATPIPGMVSVFDNGAAVDRIEFMKDGVLAELARTRAGMAATRQEDSLRYVCDNLEISAGGDCTIDDMIASTKKGLLVTCLWYIRTVDPETLLLTGLTRDGVYLIEDGVVTAAVNNFRWNESPLSLLGRITETSAPERTLCREWNDWFTRSLAPAVRVPDFAMSTVSQAY
ncbi:MAG: metallopeptidase TldD-related protein [Propionibacteriaceae bacterium]